MKKLLAILAILAAAQTAQAATCWMNTITQRILWDGRPSVVVVNGITYSGYPTDANLAAAGWVLKEYDDSPFENRVWGWEPDAWVRAMTSEEISARDAADAAAQAEAEAQATLPATFPTGVAVTNDAGHWVEFLPDGTNVVCETIAIQISASPLDPATRNAMRQSAIASRESKKQAAKNAKSSGNLQDRIAALEALLGVE